jgi:hypothetical protein
MIEVNGVQPPVAPGPIEPTGPMRASEPLGQAAGTGDVVEISVAARLAAKVHETPARIERTVTRLMEELFGGL